MRAGNARARSTAQSGGITSMYRYFKRTFALLVLAGLTALGALGGAFIPAGHATTAASEATTTINVTATEWAFKLSKKTVTPGTTVVFKVTNKGKIGHDFRIA